MCAIIALDFTTLLSIIGAISGLISIFALIYCLGYKFGKIENALSYVKPEKIGEITAKIDILWQLYVEDRKQTISQDLLKQIEKLPRKGNPTSDLEEVIKALLARLGLRINKVTISRAISEAREEGKELAEVTDLAQLLKLSPGTTLIVQVEMVTDGEKVTFSSVYRITPDRKLQLYATDMEEFDAGRHIDSLLMAKIAEKLHGYVEVISEVITVLMQGLFHS